MDTLLMKLCKSKHKHGSVILRTVHNVWHDQLKVCVLAKDGLFEYCV